MTTTGRQRAVRGLRRRAALLVLAALAVPYLALGLLEAWRDAPTFDEPVYVAAGLTALTRHDLRLNPEHPPLAKALAALPVLLAHPRIPAGDGWAEGNEYRYSAAFVRAQLPADQLRRVIFLARLVPLGETLLAAFLGYALAAALFRPAAGLVAGGLWLATPLTLGLGHLDGIDLPFTVATLAVALALHRVLRRGDPESVLLLGLAAGAALLTRDTALLVVPLAVVTVAVAGWRRDRRAALGRAAGGALVAWAVLWLGYAVLAPSTLGHPGIAPAAYVTGLRRLHTLGSQPAYGYLLGQTWTGRQWWYWPAALVLKVPVPSLVLLAAAPLAWARLPRDVRSRAFVVVGLPAGVLAAFTLAQPRTVGVRYLLPVLALLFVAAGPVAGLAAGRLRRAGLGALVGLSLIATWASAPYSLAWATPPVRPTYRVMTNSDVDWGQDLYRLRAWSRGKDPWVAYFGPRGLSARDVPGARPLPSTPPATALGWVAVSATLLTDGPPDPYGWLRGYCPVGTIGGSILLYRFSSPPDPRPGPVMPAAPCRSGPSRPSARGGGTAVR